MLSAAPAAAAAAAVKRPSDHGGDVEGRLHQLARAALHAGDVKPRRGDQPELPAAIEPWDLIA
jgi:hypothetical protein